MTWTNSNGGWHIYKDGVLQKDGTGLKTGYTIRSGGSLVLGQEQDNLGGSFDPNQRFVGVLAGLNVWNRVLPTCEIKTYSTSCSYGSGNVYSWSDFRDGIKGNTGLVVPSNCPSQSG